MYRLLPLLLAFSCQGNGSAKKKVDLDDTTPSETTYVGGQSVTWYDDVGPVLLNKCGPCHQAGGIGPFGIETFEEAVAWDIDMLDAIESGAMPPWAATEVENCTPDLPFMDDPRLTEDEKQLVRDWVAAGSPPGVERPLTVPVIPAITDADLTLGFQQPFEISGSGDVYQCFRIPVPDQGQDMFITDLQVLPDNGAVVHHVLVWTDPNDDSANKIGPDGSYRCSGQPDVFPTDLIGTWAPGQPPVVNPPGTGSLFKPGSSIVVNVHYHPTGNTTEVDNTQIKLKWTDQQPANYVTYFLVDIPFGARVMASPSGETDFHIPAGANNHEEILSFDILAWLPFQIELPIFSVMPHMHYRGTEMRVQIKHETGAPSCLVEANPFRFDFQTAYRYQADAISNLPKLASGDSLQIRCRYDNSWDNPYMQSALDAAGQADLVDVSWGEETGDEMCMAVVGFVTPPIDLWQWF